MTPDVRDTRRREPASGPQRPAPPRRPVSDDRPVEFWPTAAIRAALETDDLTVWQRIVAAIKRDPFGRTARQVEEVLQTARPYGVSKALAEVLSRTREHLEANERAEVARHIHALLDKSGLGPAGVRIAYRRAEQRLRCVPERRDQSVGGADGADAQTRRPILEDAVHAPRRQRVT